MQLGITVFLTDLGMPPGELGSAVEERGFSSLYVPEHTHLPVREDVPPALVQGVELDDYKRSIDPLIALTAAAASTKRIRLGTGVLLVAQRDPIVLAKQVATLDRLSGGRVTLGIGFGWNRAEAADHHVDFARRHAIAREHLQCMRVLWNEDRPEFHGLYVDLPPCWFWPKPLQQSVRVMVGGGANDRVLGAVTEYGDGWLPIGGAGLRDGLSRLREHAQRRGRDPSSFAVVPFGTIPSTGKLDHYGELGIGEVVLRVRNGPRDQLLRELDHHAEFVSQVAG